MNSLPEIIERDGQQLVDARTLHAGRGVGVRFNDWVRRRIRKYGFTENQDYYSEVSKTPNGGRPTTDYLLTLDMAKELAMVENNEQGREIRRYFIGVEKAARAAYEAARTRPAAPGLDWMQAALDEMRVTRDLVEGNTTALTSLTARVEALEARRSVSVAVVPSAPAPTVSAGTYSIRAYARLTGVRLDAHTANYFGRIAADRCRARSISIGKEADARYSSVNRYPATVLRKVFDQYVK